MDAKWLKIDDHLVSEQELYPLLTQYQLLPQLAKEILLDQAIADITCSPEEEQQAKERFCQQVQITTPEQFQAWLTQSGMTESQFTHSVLRELKLEKFRQQTWDSKLESYFLESKNRLDRVVYSLIRTREPGIAQELFFRVQEGESSFADLARQYSEGSEAQTGGLIGPVELNVPHPRITQLLSTSPVGKLCPPTQIGEWWVIIRLEKYLASQLDDALRQRLRNEVFQQWLTTQLQQRVSFVPPPKVTDSVWD